ncbi:MAG: glycosyltransferase family 2 protein [Parafilimonas sp.]
MKIAACVILYNPDESVIQNIKSYNAHIDKLYLIDNSESINANLHNDFNSLSHANIFHNGVNEGVAKRLNQACDFAIKDGFDYLLTMDQDSFFDEAFVSKYFECIETSKEQDVSMYGINYQQKKDELNCKYFEAKFIITSGSVINLKLFQNVGGFDEKLFIDFVDTEYCFRSIQKGFKIIEFSNIYMNHSLGEPIEKYSLKTLKKTSRSFHSATRLYYMTRNFFYINAKYEKDFSAEIKVLKKDLLNRIKNKIFYKPKRFATLKTLFQAIKDFKSKKMGKLSD